MGTKLAIAGVLLLLPCSLNVAFAQNNNSNPSGLADRTAEPQATVAPVLGTCAPTKISYIASNSTDTSTTSSSYVALPQAGRSITQAAAGCIVVRFSGVVFAPSAGRLILLRAVLDGATVSVPTNVQLSGDDDEDNDARWARAHSFEFVFPSVSAGNHTVQIEWRTPTGQQVFVHQRTLTIHHR
jgi:hypothetical protein